MTKDIIYLNCKDPEINFFPHMVFFFFFNFEPKTANSDITILSFKKKTSVNGQELDLKNIPVEPIIHF